MPPQLADRAPSGWKVYDLTYSYDFSKVKRDSGDIFIRVDYSDNHAYYIDVVEVAHQRKKRSLTEPRFWSKLSSVWKSIIGRIRSQKYGARYQPTLSHDKFNAKTQRRGLSSRVLQDFDDQRSPQGPGSFDGDVLNNKLGQAVDSYLSIGNAKSDTVFAINLSLETTTEIKIFG